MIGLSALVLLVKPDAKPMNWRSVQHLSPNQTHIIYIKS